MALGTANFSKPINDFSPDGNVAVPTPRAA
jgi:hypothetical protein